MQRREVHYLLVEDDDTHAMLVESSLKAGDPECTFDRVADGVQALARVRCENDHAHKPCPDVILLDLKIPKKSGLEVLRTLKQDEQLRMIPVVVLTTSSASRDREEAYRSHANSYVVKPPRFAEFRDLIQQLTAYWGTTNAPPIANS